MKGLFRALTGCALLIALSVQAQQKINDTTTSTVTAKTEGTITASNSATPISSKDQELILLREQNKIFKEFQSLQQTTVYWSLTGVFGLVMILVGASFYTNFRFYEKDKENLKVELDTKLDNFGSTITAQMLGQRREADQSLERNSQRIQDIMLAQLSEVRASLDGIRSEVSNEFKGVAENLAKFDTQLVAVRKSISEAEVELRKVEIEVWDAQDIPDNMMVTLLQALKAAASNGDKQGISELYERMIDILKEKYHDGGNEMDMEILTYVRRNLDVGAKYDPKGFSEVKKSLSKVKIDSEDS
ncbi:hypothetical protein [Pseudomonas sp.]|uniref:hypothetical protein n=1 Tax=Pseudomonas sp. TaxID=306 RepID=UPI0028AF5A97|nr:hypothetical protein [Pseudomonas sp.]